jgi:hypothetical protein
MKPPKRAKVNKVKRQEELQALKTEFEEFKAMTKALLHLADLASQPPHNIIQPSLNIVKTHRVLINKYSLL